jgi:SAM-dependent methyltransferase
VASDFPAVRRRGRGGLPWHTPGVTGRDPTTRFTDRVLDYVRARPSYPPGVLDLLARRADLGPGSVVVDVGSGTGILTELLLARGWTVLAVEPNRAMAGAARDRLGAHPRFRAVAGTAEETTLEDASADFAVAAQAFHWFDPIRARHELRRVLRPPHRAAVIWNMRRPAGTRFLEGYEALLQRWGIDYREVHARHAAADGLTAFFGPRGWRKDAFTMRQELDREGLLSRLFSASYTPPEGHPDRGPMLAAAGALFERHQEDGRVALEYDTEVYLGELG